MATPNSSPPGATPRCRSGSAGALVRGGEHQRQAKAGRGHAAAAGPGWSFDPQVDDAHQPDGSILNDLLQRGHLAARDYVFWVKDEEEMRHGDVHSFTLTIVPADPGTLSQPYER